MGDTMVDKLPKDITPGTPNDSSVIHASDADVSDLSRSHNERDISRLQGTAPAYDNTKIYNIGDLVTEVNVTYRNITAITTPESFNPTKWKDIDGPTIPAEIESEALLGLVSDQVVLVAGDVINWDENFVFGDSTKIVDEGSGVFRLHNGAFLLSTHMALNMSGSGAGNSAVLEWESSGNIGGPFTPIANPAGREASYSTGRADFTTQPQALALVDATGADVFVRAFLTPTATATVLNLSTEGKIESLGTSAVANTPLTTKGDVLGFDTTENRIPVGTNNQVLTADSAETLGVAWKTPPASIANAPAYSAAQTYAIGDLVVESNQVYRNITVIGVPETFDVSKWTSVDNWEEIGRVVLLSNSSTMTLTLNKQKRNLFVVFFIEASASMLAQFRFNNDSSNTISERVVDNFNTVSTQTNDNDVQISATAEESGEMSGTIDILNIPSELKTGTLLKAGTNGATAATAPNTKTVGFKWANFVDGIDEINFIKTSGAGVYTAGSYAICYGWD